MKRGRNKTRKPMIMKKNKCTNYWDLLPPEIIERVSDWIQEGNDFRSLTAACKWIREALRNRTYVRSRSIVNLTKEGLLSAVIFRCKLYESRSGFDPEKPIIKTFAFRDNSDPNPGFHSNLDWWKVSEYGAIPTCLYLECLMAACEKGHVPIVKYFLENYDRSVIHPTFDNNRALQLAINNNKVPVVKYLLSLPEVNTFLERNGGTWISGCFRIGHLEMVQYICTRHPPIWRDSLKYCFFEACMYGHVDLVIFLYNFLPRFDIGNSFQTAANNEHLNVVRYLATKVSHVEVNNCFTGCCYIGHFNIVKFLLTCPEIVIDPNFNNNAAIRSCTREYSDWAAGLKYLLRMSFWDACPCPMDVYNKGFVNACKYGAIKCVRILIKIPGVKPDYLNNRGLLQASKYGRLAVVHFLLTGNKRESFPGVRNSWSLKQAMKQACKGLGSQNHLEIMKFLSRFPEADPTNDKIMLKSVVHSSLDILGFLINEKRKQMLDTPDSFLTTLIHIAAESGDKDTYQILMSIPTGNKTSNRELALELACHEQHLDLIYHICAETENVKRKSTWAVDVSMKNNKCLKQALSHDNREVFLYLCSLKNVDGTDRVDFTRSDHSLLATVFSLGDISMVQVLLKTGSIRCRQHDFIVKFIFRSVKLFVKCTCEVKRIIFGSLFDYVGPLRDRYIRSISDSKKTQDGIVSEAWHYLQFFQNRNY